MITGPEREALRRWGTRRLITDGGVLLVAVTAVAVAAWVGIHRRDQPPSQAPSPASETTHQRPRSPRRPGPKS